ncbi:hypothetical protein BT96DRAFT_918365 [Gymnopus androsaceus JB14]|uniref:Uncharacterized protein n=1 Tax=Gymnopus androsaceus JB14 TaxID=1447944 RepID=A0A6A4HSL2_9AGAR|nr:hypothetical protein BT96DRAFT_918365 [Gymnopus androsaceus JB14]
MPQTFVKGIFNTSELRKAMTDGLKASIQHYPRPSLPLPAEHILDLSKPQILELVCAGRSIVCAGVEGFLLDVMGLKADILFSQIAMQAVETSIETLIARLAIDETKKSIKSRITSFFCPRR